MKFSHALSKNRVSCIMSDSFLYLHSNSLYNSCLSCMFKKKEISETAIMGMVYQIRYLIDEKNVSDEALGHHLGNMLSDLGIRVDYVPTPKPWEMTRKK